MCNRFRSITDWSEIPSSVQFEPRVNFEPNPNVAPTEIVPVFAARPGHVAEACMARFGITVAGRDGKPRAPLLNVRTDGLRRGQFRLRLRERRCVVPALGFYEWRDEGGKQPYLFAREDGVPLMLAGLWEISEHKGDARMSFAILTDEPNDLVAPYHDRMPLALADHAVAPWLDLSEENPLERDDLLLDLRAFKVRPMQRAMNNVRQKDLAAIEPGDAAFTLT